MSENEVLTLVWSLTAVGVLICALFVLDQALQIKRMVEG